MFTSIDFINWVFFLFSMIEGKMNSMRTLRRNRARTMDKSIRALVSVESTNLESSHHEVGQSGSDVSEIHCCCHRALVRNRGNFTRSKIPSRLMFYKATYWTDYPETICKYLREGFVNGRAAVHLELDGCSLVVDFLRMMEIDLRHSSHRWIAWIDVEGHCFFPEVLAAQNCIDCVTSSHLKSKTDSSLRGEDGEVDMVQCRPAAGLQPETIAHREVIGGTQANRVQKAVPFIKGLLLKLEDGDRAWKIIKDVFLRGMRKSSSETSVTAVYRCPPAGTRFQEFKEVAERTKAARGHTNIRYGWYGATAKDVANIVWHGFGLSNICSGSESFGTGINLSPASHSYLSASLSEPDANGERHIILCRILMGNMEEVHIGSGQAQPSCEEFDSGVDDLMNSKRFIVWSTNMNTHILPEYVLTFKCSTQQQVEGSIEHMQRIAPHECEAPFSFPGLKVSKPCTLQVGTTTDPCSRMSFPSLFSALEKSLPSFKTKALGFLYNSFKAGKVKKDVLIRKVRSIVGDPLLVSTIRSIRRQV